MAANSSEYTLPKLPNELLIVIIRCFQWTEDINELRFLWEVLRLVSPMFQDIVEKIFVVREIPNPATLLSLLSTATVTIDLDGRSFL